MLQLYENIRVLRKALKMSQAELALKTGYNDRSSIAKIEKGEVDLPQSKIALFAAALGVSAGELMGNTGILPPTLSSDEEGLLDIYRKLNHAGKDKTLEYIEDLADNPKYTKDIGLEKEKAM